MLRHSARKERLPIGPDAYVRLDLLLALPQFAVRLANSLSPFPHSLMMMMMLIFCGVLQNFTVEDVKRVVSSSDKQRFNLEERADGLYIRANQGHSIDGVRPPPAVLPSSSH